MITLCLHKWKTQKVYMDEDPVQKNKINIKEIHKCALCHKSRAFTYSQKYDQEGTEIKK